MSIIGWLIFGIIAGMIASRLANSAPEGGILDTMLAIVGALAGSLALLLIGPAPLHSLNVYGIFIAAIAAIAVMMRHDAVVARRA